jgi:hypothetical protein
LKAFFNDGRKSFADLKVLNVRLVEGFIPDSKTDEVRLKVKDAQIRKTRPPTPGYGSSDSRSEYCQD